MCLRPSSVEPFPGSRVGKTPRSGGPVNGFRKPFRTLGLGVVLLLGTALGWAAPIGPRALPAVLTRVKGLTKTSPAGARPFQSFACSSQGINCNTTVNGELTSDDCQVGSGD